MVDPQATTPAEHGGNHLPERRVAGLGQPVGPPRRQRPVLTLLAETIGRCADGCAGREDVLAGPGIRATGINANRKIMNDTDSHTAITGGRLCGHELGIAASLQPAVERDPGTQFNPRGSYRGPMGIM